MKKILLGYRLRPEGLNELEGKFEITQPTNKSYFTKEEVIDMIADYDVFVPTFGYYTDKEIIDKAPKLKLIANYGVGYNNIDVEYATSKGIVVTNTPNSTREPTAELAFALLMAAGRRIGYYDRKLRTPKGLSWGVLSELGMPIYGKTLGIVGMGRIGQSLARRAVASGMTIIYNNRNRLDAQIEKEYNATYVSFEELIKTADYVSLNAPSTPETINMFGQKEFEMMKPTAIFINTARGNMVDEQALINALRNNTIWAAALDVYVNEPKINPELLVLDNVVLAPHVGTKTLEDRVAMMKEMSRNILGFYGEPYKVYRVN